MKKPVKIVLFVLFVAGLYLVTNKVIVPLVLKVIDSELYMKPAESDDPVGELHNGRTYAALLHCENQLRTDRGLDSVTRPSAAEDEYKAWGLGDHTYVVKAALDLPGPDKNPVRSNVACKIKYEGGDEAQPASWSIFGAGTEGN